ncbi:PucR family transcriptional regulator [Nitriliruptor alkaliphilus]|uniref:PucR family transcriptional regulator n=1 Tax=Nitriliruptor alkaliphilus TaxID=427918 RepID=UPI000698AD1F|nr:PucR family transcriptional regulator [Nitriliruptor alkaliphilus]
MIDPASDVPGAPLGGALALREVLTTPTLTGSRVLAGAAGLERPVERLNVMEVPDITRWVKPHEFLLTTAYPLRGRPETLPGLIADLDDAGLAGLGIKLGRYLDEAPADMIEAAEARGFPLVQLPDDVGFDEILNEVLTAILHRQAQLLARSERVHRAFLQLVLNGHGLPEIARDLAELITAPAVIVDLDGRPLAHAGLDQLGIEDPARVVLDPGGATVCVDGERVACTAVRISAGPREHGHVVALSRGEAPTDDLVALENAATVAALALTQRLEVRAVEDKYRSDLMHDLLREVDDPDDARRRAAGFGWDLDRRLIVLVVRLDTPPEPVIPDEITRRTPLVGAMRRAILDRDPTAAIARFSHEAVIVTAAFDGPDGRDEARRFSRRLIDDAIRTVEGTLSAGLSRPVETITDISRAYEQATRALVIGRGIHGPGALAHFDDLGAYRVLSLVEDHAELRSFATEVLGELAADTDNAEDLRRTLQTLLDTGGNVAEAARQLHFHYNTLRYRVDKLESIVGPFTTDARIRLDVHLALMVFAMRGLDGRS